VSVDLAKATGSDKKVVSCLPSVPDYDRVRRLAADDPVTLNQSGAVVGACGSANHTKGVDLWLDLVARVAAALQDMTIRFVWVGGDRPAEFEPWAARTGLGEQVTFTGAVDNPYRWMSAFDVFTLTSRSDPFPLVVLEAMSLGKPVVAFAVGDVPYQVGDGGVLVEAEASADAARQVVSLLDEPETRAVLSAHATHRTHDHFAFEAFAAGVLELAAGGPDFVGQPEDPRVA
jgi:glycosyltransferase involved in cell wall biosynthesis